MNPIERLSEIFSHFPGIGPRQAKRFVYYLLSRDQLTLETLASDIAELKKDITQCLECRRFFPRQKSDGLCPTCADPSRESSLLMIVPRDADYEQMERSGGYKGYYFVLGGSLPILEKEPAKRIRINDLKKLIEKKEKDLKEIILAMNANAEGENTADFIKETFKADSYVFSILGRGLSSGTELEYADPDTLKNALLHRTK